MIIPNVMKYSRVRIGFLTICLLSFLSAQGQAPATYFHSGASLFIKGKNAEAKQELMAGLAKYPQDPKLNALLKEIKEEDQQDQQDKQDQQKKDKEKQDKEKKDKQQKEQEQKDQQQKDQQQKEQEEQQQQQAKNQKNKPTTEQQKEEDSPDGKESKERKATEQKLKQMNLTEEKARMILDAMKNGEVQYLQQRKREKTKKTDKGQPDW
jgi:type IV secretory pathway VirB10-like protein